MIHLSKRLLAIASMVSPGTRPVDVGCDHGYIPIYLVQSQKVKHVLAMDIGEGPLCQARKHVCQEGLEGEIELRQSDGLCAYKKGEANSLLISGMGGILMCDILSSAADRGLLSDFQELILSPHSDQAMVRRFLHEQSFCIDKEDMVRDDGKYYMILHAVSGSQKFDNETDYIYGKYLIDHRHPLLYEYLQKQLQKKEEIYKQIQGRTTPHALEYQPALLADIRQLQSLCGLWEDSHADT